jgi:hypothetical protein
VNLADTAILARLVGDSVAQGIVAARQERPFASTAQLLGIQGFRVADIALFTVDGPGIVHANAASVRILGSLPGFASEAAERIAWRRASGRPFTTLDELAGQVSPAARAELIAHYADLVRTLAFQKQQLVVTAEGRIGPEERAPGSGSLRSTIELVVVPLPERLAVIRRRMW